jgi:diaminohydroxyphosphoribosylaminopyrimidine deaminase/5-amino-6-(5-phosphoribosylamino)uracil reductase
MFPMSQDDRTYMLRALELARKGRGAVEPNPMVGAVIVRDGRVLGEGFHQRFGRPHAEIEALDAARKAGHDPAGATLYVTLEPCCHHGKTPPCTDALIAARLGRVVAGMTDPDENVAGKGFQRLRQAGVEVQEGVCEDQARKLLAAYVKLRTQRRPWVILKWAQTHEGYLALPNGAGRWISCPASRERVHELRGLCDGVLVGIGTALADDPLLTNRGGRGRAPARVVLDSQLRLPPASQLVQTARRTPLIVATLADTLRRAPEAVENLRRAGAEILALSEAAGHVSLPALLDEFGRRSWTYLLVEGGREVLQAFLSTGLADELQVFIGPQRMGQVNLPRLDVQDIIAGGGFALETRETIGPDEFLLFRRQG